MSQNNRNVEDYPGNFDEQLNMVTHHRVTLVNKDIANVAEEKREAHFDHRPTMVATQERHIDDTMNATRNSNSDDEADHIYRIIESEHPEPKEKNAPK